MSDLPRILVVGYRKFSELINAVMPEFAQEADITIVESVASGSVDYRQLIDQHRPDAVASAGSNASYLQATLSVPVVAQPVSDTDIVEALGKARRVGAAVHLFSYAQQSSPSERLLASLPDLLGVQLAHHRYQTTDEAAERLLLACSTESPAVVVGPSYICHLAEQRGVPAILMYSAESTRRLLRDAVEAARTVQLQRAPRRDAGGSRFVIHSAQMARVARLARTYARGSAAVLLQGESGTGKEHIAREIHRQSDFAAGRLVAVNCGSIPNELFESELFGHVEGAFTSSRRGGRTGLVERANGGVLFLDEVAEMPVPQQVKLLRVLQERCIRPVGSNREIALEFKLIAATNRDLRAAVQAGEFRDDLYFRLNVFRLQIPPLRDRPEDIAPIVRYYLEEYARQYRVALDVDALLAVVAERLQAYRWPGNVRELQNFAERLVVNCIDGASSGQVESALADILPELFETGTAGVRQGMLREREAQAIREALGRFGNDRQRAAEFLGISTTTLWRRMKQMNNPGAAH